MKDSLRHCVIILYSVLYLGLRNGKVLKVSLQAMYMDRYINMTRVVRAGYLKGALVSYTIALLHVKLFPQASNVLILKSKNNPNSVLQWL